MFIKSANFIASYAHYKDCPDSIQPEYAFIGRSNVGKSSLINYITNRNKLAKTSSTPGKTQLINFFNLNEEWYLVDLPGYGYARVSKSQRAKFERMIRDYLVKRESLWCVFLLIDSRIPPQDSDLQMINFMGAQNIPFVLVFTKADKPEKVSKNIDDFKEKLSETWEEFPKYFVTSSSKRDGAEELLNYIDEQNIRAKEMREGVEN